MSTTVPTVTVTAEVPLTVEMLAQGFAHLDDDQQAQFFVRVAAIADETFAGMPGMQWHMVGRHLRDCTCNTEQARGLVLAIASAMDPEPAFSRS